MGLSCILTLNGKENLPYFIFPTQVYVLLPAHWFIGLFFFPSLYYYVEQEANKFQRKTKRI